MSRTTVRAKGQITLPDDVRRAAHLEEGDLLDAEITTEGILLRPQKLIDATQTWFWTTDWQAGERDADVDHAAERVSTFASGEELLGSLRQRSKPTRQRKKS
ncbi:MAG TPA: AbrB/MazE/SpoVT family DNA-binding domain-containing protein [Acidimicrobiales bacterium]|nr:AbrB/MazE/SpoVT family DNA-binding domain-containing protein [Acidimicrobiales bacterium]